jgi:hypothetical protein
MPFSMSCPECQELLDFDDEKKIWRVHCFWCGAEFIAKETDLSAEQIEERRRLKSLKRERGSLRPHVRTELDEVKRLATALKVLGWLGVVPGILLIFLGVLFATSLANDAEFLKEEKTTREETLLVGGLQIVQGLCGIITGIVILIGAGKLSRFEGRQWVIVAAVLGMLPLVSGCCFLGIPFGVMTLQALNRPRIREHFNKLEPNLD